MYIRPNMSEQNVNETNPVQAQTELPESAQVSLSEIFSQAESKLIEVKILKQLKYLPLVFMIKTKYGQVQKVSLTNQDKLDCSKYESNTGLTFSGCYVYKSDELKETRGIYYTPISPFVTLSYRGKISRSLNEMKEIIKLFIENDYLLKNNAVKEFLISYDNYSVSVYDKFRKGKLLEFEQIKEQGHLEIFAIPQPKYADVLEFRFWNEIQIYNHELKFDKKVLAYEPYVRPGIAIIIFTMDQTEMNISSPDHGDMTLILDAKKFYILVHPRPITNRVD